VLYGLARATALAANPAANLYVLPMVPLRLADLYLVAVASGTRCDRAGDQHNSGCGCRDGRKSLREGHYALLIGEQPMLADAALFPKRRNGHCLSAAPTGGSTPADKLSARQRLFAQT